MKSLLIRFLNPVLMTSIKLLSVIELTDKLV